MDFIGPGSDSLFKEYPDYENMTDSQYKRMQEIEDIQSIIGPSILKSVDLYGKHLVYKVLARLIGNGPKDP